MKILVINAGSSSLRYGLIEMPKKQTILRGHVDAIGLKRCRLVLEIDGEIKEQKKIVNDHVEAVVLALDSLKKNKLIKTFNEIKVVGHRVVHGGEFYKEPVEIDSTVIKNIKRLSELAPLHNPPNLAGILTCKKILPHTEQFAVFDTAFHQTIPREAFMYGIPYEFYVKYHIRKYGFHGISHKYLSYQAGKLLGKRNAKMITCHLGNGSSITAIKDGKSVDTTMGFTPMDGLMMGTRSGDLDPDIPLYLIKKKHYTATDIETILNRKSGLLGISKETSDIRELKELSDKGDDKAGLALDMLAYKIALYIGSYHAILGGAECIVFSGGIGENAWFVRENVFNHLKGLDLKYDKTKNKNNEIIISTDDSKIKLYVIPTDEELEIAKEVYTLI